MDIDPVEIYNDIKHNISKQFKENWLKLIKDNNNYQYSKIQDNFATKKWFSLLPFIDRRHVTTIIRMRTGHCLTDWGDFIKTK